MQNKQLTAYISGALIGSKDLQAARLKYENLANLLNQIDIQPYLPHQQTDPIIMTHLKPEDVFEKDITALYSCDLIIVFLDEPSLGVGAEIALAINQHKQVVAVYPHKQVVSRFILGMLKKYTNSTIIQYSKLDDITKTIQRKYSSLVNS